MFLSLLYPSEAAYAASKEKHPRIAPSVCEELGLCRLLPLQGAALSDFFTCDEKIIAYREEMFEDLAATPSLCSLLTDAVPTLLDILELRRLDDSLPENKEDYLYSMTEIELYVSLIDRLAAGLGEVRPTLKSAAFLAFADRVIALSQSDYYRELNEALSRLSSRIREVKSITFGVNLDEKLQVKSAGVLSINPESFKSGEVLDKILRMSFKNDGFTCIAKLLPFDEEQSENRRDAMQHAFHGALRDIFRSSVREWRGVVSAYVLENTDFLLKLLPELAFITKGAAYIEKIKAHSLPLCHPTLCKEEDKALSAKGLYNPDVALRTEAPMVKNDIDFDENGKIYLLSGPNRGGKSVVTCAVGQLVALAELGLPVPAESAALSPADGIFTHFPEGAEDTVEKGRLGEECERLGDILQGATENSLVLLDESLSSTGAFEAAYIASEIICGFAVLGCRVLFSTHLHDLAARVEEMNEKSQKEGGVKIDTLMAGMQDGERSFKITRCRPDGKSYAKDIASRYGLSLDAILANVKKK